MKKQIKTITTLSAFQSDVRNGYFNVKGRTLGSTTDNSVGPIQLMALGYISPHWNSSSVGTQVLLKERPEKDFILKVSHSGETYTKKFYVSEYSSPWKEYVIEGKTVFKYDDGKSNQDWFNLHHIYNGTPMTVTYSVKSNEDSLDWDDSLIWDDNELWTEIKIEGKWDDSLLWDDSLFWIE